MKKKIEKIAKIILNILTGVVIISIFFALYGLLQVTILDKDYANYFGYSLFVVESGSMSPTINEKDMVVVQKTKDIKANDIFTYKSGNSFITHRAVDVNKNRIVAKGDFNNYEDKTIQKKNVIGKVKLIIPKFGLWKKILLSPLVIIIIFITLLLFSVGISYENKNIVVERNKPIRRRFYGIAKKKFKKRSFEELEAEIPSQKPNSNSEKTDKDAKS